MTQPMLAKCVPKILSADQGRALVDEWRQSGLSRAAYARQHRIGAHLLTYWEKKILPSERSREPVSTNPSEATDVAFVQVPLSMAISSRPTPPTASPIEIRLVGGAVVRVFTGVDPDLLGVVLQTLARASC
jgi:hypothetical protein